MNHLPDSQYYCIKYLDYYYYLFQASDEKIIEDINPIGKADIKVDSEEFCDANDDQANYDGTRWIIICLFIYSSYAI